MIVKRGSASVATGCILTNRWILRTTGAAIAAARVGSTAVGPFSAGAASTALASVDASNPPLTASDSKKV